jgi:hypothetical protein
VPLGSPAIASVAVSEYPRVECETHGWQSSALVTRYDRKAKPRDVPDRYMCIQCAIAKVPADATNSIKIAPNPDER